MIVNGMKPFLLLSSHRAVRRLGSRCRFRGRLFTSNNYNLADCTILDDTDDGENSISIVGEEELWRARETRWRRSVLGLLRSATRSCFLLAVQVEREEWAEWEGRGVGGAFNGNMILLMTSKKVLRISSSGGGAEITICKNSTGLYLMRIRSIDHSINCPVPLPLGHFIHKPPLFALLLLLLLLLVDVIFAW